MNTVEPIRSQKKIDAVKKYLLGCGKIRDYVVFSLGINTGLRASDLLSLKWMDVLKTKKNFKEIIYIREQKTKKEKKFPINDNAKKALKMLLSELNDDNFSMENYIFVSRKSKEGKVQPISTNMEWRVIKGACEAVGVEGNTGTHTMRKTWGYWAWKKGIPLAVIMEVFNHNSLAVTKRYLGITQDEINKAYMHLNL